MSDDEIMRRFVERVGRAKAEILFPLIMNPSTADLAAEYVGWARRINCSDWPLTEPDEPRE